MLANGDVYVGSTNDLRRRFKSHQRGEVSVDRAISAGDLEGPISRSSTSRLRGAWSAISNPDQGRLSQRSVSLLRLLFGLHFVSLRHLPVHRRPNPRRVRHPHHSVLEQASRRADGSR
ncbi:MAG TPA: GIY-YIG nuclease family protein [Xanthobacteraceae bacterium]